MCHNDLVFPKLLNHQWCKFFTVVEPILCTVAPTLQKIAGQPEFFYFTQVHTQERETSQVSLQNFSFSILLFDHYFPINKLHNITTVVYMLHLHTMQPVLFINKIHLQAIYFSFYTSYLYN